MLQLQEHGGGGKGVPMMGTCVSLSRKAHPPNPFRDYYYLYFWIFHS